MITSALAESDVLDAKNGVVMGLGLGGSGFSFPDTYTGDKKKNFDDSANLFGAMGQVGYDTLLFRRLLIGLRAEGFTLDTFKTGNTKTNELTGKTSAFHTLLRLGFVFTVRSYDPVGNISNLSLELFLEGGPTKGKRMFDKKYDPDGSSDGYAGSLVDDYKGTALAGGMNLTSISGAFFEVKALYTSVSDSKQTFKGSKTEGGVATDLASIEGKKKNFTSVFIVFGHHF